MSEELKHARNIIIKELEKAGLRPIKILLFGSRIREDFNEDSDWDFLVIVDKEMSFPEKKKIISEISLQLIDSGIPNDLILKDRTKFEMDKEIVGSISFFANREGRAI